MICSLEVTLQGGRARGHPPRAHRTASPERPAGPGSQKPKASVSPTESAVSNAGIERPFGN